MSSNTTKCVVILSTKSSGSSALQNFLIKQGGVSHVARTRHYEHETLYWTKAASVLGLEQQDMLDSEVPIPAGRARADLLTLLRDELGTFEARDDDDLIYRGWRELCVKHSPVFLEKSPHHLHQWSALNLLTECGRRMPEVEFRFIGLVRNPMDTLYSMWSRWRMLPERHQYEWLTAYRNLLRLKDVLGERLFVLRYEDMVRDPERMRALCDFLGIAYDPASAEYLHDLSVSKWRLDRNYGFQPCEELKAVAARLGYPATELENPVWALWPVYRQASRALWRSDRFMRRCARWLLGISAASPPK